MPTTAAIIATCDRPDLLDRALASVCRQGSAANEIIVVNDGRTDLRISSATVLRTGPYAGPAAARNAGVHAANSEFLAFLDDDDEWTPDHIESISRLLTESEVAATAFHRHTRSGKIEFREPPSALRASDWFVENRGIQGSNLAVRRRAYLDLLGFDELLWCGEDMDFAIRCADRAVGYAMSATPTVICHSHSQPRITSPGERHRHAHRTFLAAYGSRMSKVQVQAFRERVTKLFGVDPGPVPRLIWILGPPGAGKTTWASRHVRGLDRVLDLVDAMPWLDGADLGVRTAKRHLAAAIRATETGRADCDRRLFVTPAYFGPEDLGPVHDFEHVIAIVPSPQQWHAQLMQREGRVDERHAHEYQQWAARYGTGARAANPGLIV